MYERLKNKKLLIVRNEANCAESASAKETSLQIVLELHLSNAAAAAVYFEEVGRVPLVFHFCLRD